MALGNLSDPSAVLAAIAEFDHLGRDEFLEKHGFREARSYFLELDGRLYDSKAIVGVAHGYQHGDALRARDFIGGEATVRRKLESLGFNVKKTSSSAMQGSSTINQVSQIGPLAGIEPGARFANRRELYNAGVHRALQAGIVGRPLSGAESIVLSGGYVDDEDFGTHVIYTGDGGRDQNTGKQIDDQRFTGKNQSLVTSCLDGLPVRVVRGSAHTAVGSPESGYRYDGLYRVERYWRERGKHGFLVCRFEMRPYSDQAYSQPVGPGNTSAGPALRSSVTIQRIVRDSALGRRVKSLHDHTCQVCETQLMCEGGPYAEAAHIRPVGAPHNGPDVLDNLLCLCPNHHVQFDRGGFTIDADLRLIGLPGQLRTMRNHVINAEHIAYHRAMWSPES